MTTQDSTLRTQHSAHLLSYIPALPLNRLGADSDAGLCITSLPWPRAQAQALSLAGQPTYVEPLGQWPGEEPGSPRRLLMVADSGGSAQASLHPAPAVETQGVTPTPEMVEFERSPEPAFMWHRHFLRVSWGGQSLGIAMGLRHAGEVHWWEACRLVEVASTPTCRVVEMGGAIPRELCTLEMLAKYPGYSNPHLHLHNWLTGKLYLRLHANGVCEVFAHHINGRLFDDGLTLEDVVPVLGFRLAPDLDRVRFDLSEVERLATPEHPMRRDEEYGFQVLQPYPGVELFGGVCPLDLTGDPYIFHAETATFPRGMARTLRFSFSLSDRSPRVARYLAPAWWYGVCEEFLPAPLLPAVGDYESEIDNARAWYRDFIVRGGFEDGSLPRNAAAAMPPGGRYEPGWEGEAPYAAFLGAWRSGDAEDYACALRAAYFFNDVAIDHASLQVRMHGYPSGKFAPPMNRVQGSVAAYLETGDPFFIDSARAVVETTFWLNKAAWPRLAVGRDAFFIRGAVLLYRYFAEEQFRRYAYETSVMVVQSQRESGSFGDQGGGTGIHAWGGYITKPWMGLMALGPVLDYLELFPDEPALLEAVRRFADWLLAEQWERDGKFTWSYQHDYNGERRHYDPYSARWGELPTPYQWHQETLARLLGYCAIRFDNPTYFEAWRASHETVAKTCGMDHEVNAIIQFLPWLQAKLANATLGPDGITIDPPDLGPTAPATATVLAPQGPVPVRLR